MGADGHIRIMDWDKFVVDSGNPVSVCNQVRDILLGPVTYLQKLGYIGLAAGLCFFLVNIYEVMIVTGNATKDEIIFTDGTTDRCWYSVVSACGQSFSGCDSRRVYDCIHNAKVTPGWATRR